MVDSSIASKKSSRPNIKTVMASVVIGLFVVALMPVSAVFPSDGTPYALVAASTDQSLIQITCTLSTGYNNGNYTPGDIPQGNFTDGFPSGAFPSGGFPSGGFPSGGFPSGAFPSGGIPSGAFPSDGNFNYTPGSRGNGALGMNSVMNVSSYSDISSIANVVTVVPVLQVFGGQNQMPLMNQSSQMPADNYLIVGVPLDSSIIDNCPVLPTNITDGRNLQAGDSDVVLLSETNSVNFEAGVGDTVTLLGTPFTVVGVHGTSEVSDSLALYMSLSDAQSITNNTGCASRLEVFVASNADVTQTISAINSLHPELTVVSNQNGAFSSPSPNATQTEEQQGDSTYLYVIVVAALCVVAVVALIMVRKRRQKTSAPKPQPHQPFQMANTTSQIFSYWKRFSIGNFLGCKTPALFAGRSFVFATTETLSIVLF